MTFAKLIETAADAYPEGGYTLMPYLEDELADCGDTLALFVFRELKDTYNVNADEAQQLEDAIAVLERAKFDLEDVISEFETALADL